MQQSLPIWIVLHFFFSVSWSNAQSVVLNELNPQMHCPGDTIELEVMTDPVSFPFTTPWFRYEISRDSGFTWSAWLGQTRLDNIVINGLPDSVAFRVIVAEEANELSDPNLSILSDTLYLDYDLFGNCYTNPVMLDGGLCTEQLGDPLFPGGNFGRGNAPFRITGLAGGDTKYTFRDSTNQTDWANATTYYAIVNNLENDLCTNEFPFSCLDLPLSDNSDERRGYAMFVNTNGGDDRIFFRGDVSDLCEQTTYQFSVAIRNAANPSFNVFDPNTGDGVILPNIEFVIGSGNSSIELLQVVPAIANSGPIPNDGNWNVYGFSFTTNPGVTAISFAMRNSSDMGPGNDFLIDDIAIQTCGSAVLEFPTEICDNEANASILAKPGPPFTMPQILWQSSTNHGLDWSTISTVGADSLVINPLDTNTIYRYVVAEDLSKLSRPGCRVNSDSTDIQILPQITNVLFDTLCNGQSTSFNNTPLDQTGVYPFTFVAANGCDSIVEIHLTVLDSLRSTQNIGLCEGETFMGVTFPADTTITLLFSSTRGCDSLATLNINIIEPIRTNNIVQICPGTSFEGHTYLRDTTLLDSLTSITGCDSLVMTQISLFSVDEIVENIPFCLGGIYEGIPIRGDTTIIFNQFDQNGCVQERMVNITAEEPEEFVLQGDPTLCRGEQTFLEVVGEFDSIRWSTGATNVKQITVSQSGLYGVTVTTEENCVQSNEVTILTTDLSPRFSVQPPLCVGVDDGFIRVDTVVGGIPPYVYAIDGGTFQSDSIFLNLKPDIYTVEINDSQGCNISEAFELPTPDSFNISPPSMVEIELGNQVLLSATPDSTLTEFAWTPSEGLSCDSCRITIAGPDISTSYAVTATNANGCDATTTIEVFVNDISTVFVPNIFTPNSDGINDFLRPFTSRSVTEIIHFAVYDRWGNTMYEANNFLPDSETIRWNGSTSTQFASEGVYAWYVEVELSNGALFQAKGDVVLIR